MIHLLALALSVQFPPVLNPTVYRSASGDLTLEVDPGEPDGSGAGHYTFTRRGEVIWERDHPFTFFDAAVGDDGIVAGVSYSRGLGGGGYDESQGDLRLVVLEPDGKARFEHVMPRMHTRVIHGFPAPQSNGVLLDEANGRVLMRLDPEGAGGEEWWLYDLSTGEPVGRVVPEAPAQSYLAGVSTSKLYSERSPDIRQISPSRPAATMRSGIGAPSNR